MVKPPCPHTHRTPRLSCNNLVMERPQAKGIHLHQVTVLPQRLPDMGPLGMGPPSLGMEPHHLLQAMGQLDPHLRCKP